MFEETVCQTFLSTRAADSVRVLAWNAAPCACSPISGWLKLLLLYSLSRQRQRVGICCLGQSGSVRGGLMMGKPFSLA